MSNFNESLNESLNQRLQTKYPHLELAVLPLSQVNKDNESKRIDSEYFKKEYLENEKLLLNLDSVKLSNFCSFICNGVDCRDYDESGLKYIRTGDIKDYGLDLYNCATIRDDFTSNIKLEMGDLLITRKGNYGKSQVVDNKEILESIISSEIFQLKLKEINPYFVDIFLKSKFGQIQFEKNIHGVSNFSVTQEALLNFLIPQFSQDFQLEIERLVKVSHKALEDSKTLYKEAENLLYESLGLDFINPLESLQSTESSLRCAKSRNDDIIAKYPHLNISIRTLTQSYGKSGRLDSEYYQSKYDAIERTIKDYQGGYCRLQDLILSYSGGFAFSSDDYLESGDLALIRINNIKNANLDMSNAVYLKNNAINLSPKDKVKQGDILISMSGSIGLSCLVREYIEAMTNQRILKVSIKDFSGDVLVLLLNSIFCKLQFERIGTGGVQTNISSVDILNVLIPKIDSTAREQITSKIQKSFALRKVAKDLLESAKSKVEHAIDSK